MTTARALETVRVIDTDTHVCEPADLFKARVPNRLRDAAPEAAVHPETGYRTWRIADVWLREEAWFAQAGWTEYPPVYPKHLDDAGVDPGAWSPSARLARMDEYGIYAQVLYPNVIGFYAPLFMRLEPEVSLACVRAYNDYLTEFASHDTDRLLPIAMVPFWDIAASVAEITRCYEVGHRGVLFANKYEKIGLPPCWDAHWDPIYAAAQEMGLSINFHVAVAENDGRISEERRSRPFDPSDTTTVTTGLMLGNAEPIARITTSGVCERFPELKFVSVESGFGYIPYLLESLDWHWIGQGGRPSLPLLPSEYFRRQCYGTFWFETTTLPLLELYADNMMFETDYPHPTSLSPGPTSPALPPNKHIATYFNKVPVDVAHKVLHDNAARLYHVE
jgi:predicted TIM-barrel fold metal-dependent hydrolase